MLRLVPRRAVRSAGIAALVLAASCTTTNPGSDWWTFQHDVGHTGFVRGGMGRNPKQIWSTALVAGTTSLTPPVFGAIRDTFRIFIGSGYGGDTLFALSPNNGAILWKFAGHINNGFFGAPVAADSNVYAATLGQTPHVYAVRQRNGTLVWQTPLPTGTRASVTVGYGRVYVHTDDHRVYALSQANGAILWSSVTTPSCTHSTRSPARSSGCIRRTGSPASPRR
jgi:outer membrane protein assembly factor BamB